MSVVPIRNHWEFVPLFALCVVCIILMVYHWKLDTGWTRPLFWRSVIAVLCVLMIAFFFPQLTFLKAWEWFDSSTLEVSRGVWRIGILALIVGLVWFVKRHMEKKVSNEGSETVGHTSGTGHGEKKSGLVKWLVIGFLVYLAVQFVGAAREWQRQNAPELVGQSSRERSFRVQANPGIPTAVFLGRGTNVSWTIEGPGHIMYRFNGGPEQEDWQGQNLRLPNWNDDRTAYLRSKESFPVTVRVYLTTSGS